MALICIGLVQAVGVDPTDPDYNITWEASATDGTHTEFTSNVLLHVPYSTILVLGVIDKAALNLLIAEAIQTWVQSLHGWTIGLNQIIIGGLFDLV